MSRDVDLSKTIRPSKFAHIVLRTRDLERTQQWYINVLGMEVIFANEMVAFMSYDEEHHRLALFNTPGEAPPSGASGLDHFAYSFNELGDLLQAYKRLKALEILPVWCINHGPTTSLYYEDPDGIRVELQVDNFSTEEELKGYMYTEAFETNPIGVEFSPDRLLERYENGDSMEELILQGSA